ncbi:testis enhanced transcript [Capsaspora owczarzaki ATCC 30864]|uniref:Testis enhanced transcript n=1 Tax=Capsaspora owczarzaki (strain ATCC 30864) TaxID=595528 RepID=A0A0D2WST8_CAPO3|nr:testis enhanced transcript [Capsaspora owczarzaki ATCC 30864]KJE94568.1 testis enhanced transcript [Capsaspora owczarzaki ATCC 30864]|eukprot:XP_004346882.1 testis enhanced transcript [Capsaspora owczarzaki ATCC 30864]
MTSLFDRPLPFEAFGQFHNIDAKVQSHLKGVYATLAASVLIAALGATLGQRFAFAFEYPYLVSFACLGFVLWLAMNPEGSSTFGTRAAMFGGYSFFQGVALAPLVWLLAEIDPSIVSTAFLGSVAIFASFSLTALYAQRRVDLWLGGLLSSGLSVLCWTNLLAFFFPSMFFFNIQLYLGLMVFCGYVIFDTQVIIFKATRGDRDVIMHSLELFLDFVNIFVRIASILGKDKKKKK